VACDPAAEWETRRDALTTATADGVAALLPPGKASEIGFTPGFLEMMEQDFDKAEGPDSNSGSQENSAACFSW